MCSLSFESLKRVPTATLHRCMLMLAFRQAKSSLNVTLVMLAIPLEVVGYAISFARRGCTELAFVIFLGATLSVAIVAFGCIL